MNGITEPLPGLLDDPQFQITDLPALTDFHIAPLRNPAPLRHSNVPLPLEPVTGNAINGARNPRTAAHSESASEKRRTPKITPTDVLLAREAKKPHLAISELLEDNDGSDTIPIQLPSFISLSVVEKSPIQTPSALGQQYPSKRPRLDQDADYPGHDVTRHLPRPAQKDGRQSRPAPLLPAMVTGLHEPPPSAALLPSMDLDVRPGVPRTTSSKIKVTDMLMNSDARNPSPIPPSSLKDETVMSKEQQGGSPHAVPTANATSSASQALGNLLARDSKARRTRRKWTDGETQDLLAGVKKYGIGKWKQILDDPAYFFTERSSVDLKDRYRVCAKDDTTATTLSASLAAKPMLSSSSSTAVDSPQTADLTPAEASLLHQQQKQRRKRRAWTAAEDESLIKGVTKHGFQWTAIHDDLELDLGHRRATDLRDRIRNRFPDGYRQAESAPLRSEVKKAEKLRPPSGSGKRLSSAEMASSGVSSNVQDKERERELPGVTLPSLTLDDEDMDWDNRLPPVLLPWDEIGIGM